MFDVTKVADTNDGTCDSDCSLREALVAANLSTGADTITFSDLGGSPDVYGLSIAGTGEDLSATGDLDITDEVEIIGNGVESTIIDGGAIDRVFQNDAFNVDIRHLTIRNGVISGNGGGILNNGDLELDNVVISGNSADQGGGIYSNNTLFVIESTVDSNNAGLGAGIAAVDDSFIFLERSLLSNNQATNQGGGLLVTAASAEIINSTISGNSAGTSGGGIESAGFTFLRSSTIVRNDAPTGGGINVVDSTSMVTTIVAENLNGGDCASLQVGLSSLGYNLDSDGTCLLTATGDLSATPPVIGDLQDNGGPTLTHALLVGSPALDAGEPIDCAINNEVIDPNESDQRGLGFSRFVDSLGNGSRCDIGAYEAGGVTLSGRKFQDLNGDGSDDSGMDPGFGGFDIELYLDVNLNGTFEASTDTLEQSTSSASPDGSYSFTDVGPGQYIIVEVVPTGFTATTPSNPALYAVETTNGQDQSGLDFGNFRNIDIFGRKYEDLNRDGSDNTEFGGQSDTLIREPGLGGFVIELYLDTNLNGVIDSADTLEQSTVSDPSTGEYSFTDIGPGQYLIQEIQQAGFTQTQPTGPEHYVIVTSSGQFILDLNFGNVRDTSITGRKYEDLDGDGSDNGGTDPGLGGFVIELYFDENGNGVIDGADILEQSVVSTDGTGEYLFEAVDTGDYLIREVQQSGFTATEPSSAVYAVTVEGEDLTGLDFGNFENISISGTIHLDADCDVSVDDGEFGLAGITVFLDLNGDGILDLDEPRTTTDASGDYSFSDLGPGDYTVMQVTPDGAIQLNSDPGAISAQSGGDITGIDFFNHPLLTSVIVDPADVTKTAVLVVGTEKSDNIVFKKISNNRVKVLFNDINFGIYHATGRIIAMTGGGNDSIRVDSKITKATLLDGGTGKDRIIGGSGRDVIKGGAGADKLFGGGGYDVLVGGSGNDRLFGGSGRDILIGGTGLDQLDGGAAQDVLVGDSTIHDANDEALRSLIDEWSSRTSGYGKRMQHLRGALSGGLNGTVRLNSKSISSDGSNDKLTGGADRDLFYKTQDTLLDRVANENIRSL